MKNTIYKTYAIDNADIVRMEAQGHSEKESLEFCKNLNLRLLLSITNKGERKND